MARGDAWIRLWLPPELTEEVKAAAQTLDAEGVGRVAAKDVVGELFLAATRQAIQRGHTWLAGREGVRPWKLYVAPEALAYLRAVAAGEWNNTEAGSGLIAFYRGKIAQTVGRRARRKVEPPAG